MEERQFGIEKLRQSAVEKSRALQRGGDKRLEQIVRSAASQYEVSCAAISIITDNRQVLITRIGIDVPDTHRDQAFCATAIQRPGEALVVHDAQSDPRFKLFASVAGDLGIRSMPAFL